MHTNHNRIKVSDLETDDPDKILVTNSKGELEFIATKNIKVDSYNALDYDQEGKVLDARQGKILKDLVNNKTDKGGFQGTAQDLAKSIPDLNSSNLKLGSYPSTRNDGQLSTNKVLSTDASGNLKLYSLPTSITYPAPYLTEILPNNYLPDTTTNIVLKGSFFTPTMMVAIQGQTVNYLTFKSDNEVHVNVTTGSEEGSFGVTLNNGLSVTFPDVLLIVLGTVYQPNEIDWVDKSTQLNVSEKGTAKIRIFNTYQIGTWDKELDFTKNYRVQFYFKRSPFGSPTNINEYTTPHLSLNKVSDDSVLFYFSLKSESPNLSKVGLGSVAHAYSDGNVYNFNPSNISEYDAFEMVSMEFRFISGVMYFYAGNGLTKTFTDIVTENLKIKVKLKTFDLVGIKYIETT